jgi:hypothetical protein
MNGSSDNEMSSDASALLANSSTRRQSAVADLPLADSTATADELASSLKSEEFDCRSRATHSVMNRSSDGEMPLDASTQLLGLLLTDPDPRTSTADEPAEGPLHAVRALLVKAINKYAQLFILAALRDLRVIADGGARRNPYPPETYVSYEAEIEAIGQTIGARPRRPNGAPVSLKRPVTIQQDAKAILAGAFIVLEEEAREGGEALHESPREALAASTSERGSALRFLAEVSVTYEARVSKDALERDFGASSFFRGLLHQQQHASTSSRQSAAAATTAATLAAIYVTFLKSVSLMAAIGAHEGRISLKGEKLRELLRSLAVANPKLESSVVGAMTIYEAHDPPLQKKTRALRVKRSPGTEVQEPGEEKTPAA